jgi:hypothetical protein
MLDMLDLDTVASYGVTLPPPCVRQVQERQFFERHTVYRCISSRMGTPYLTRLLNSVRGLRT